MSAILTYNQLTKCHFLSLLVFTPHFAPHNFLSSVAFKGHGSFISGVTDAICQSAWRFVRGGGGCSCAVCGFQTAVLRWVGKSVRPYHLFIIKNYNQLCYPLAIMQRA